MKATASSTIKKNTASSNHCCIYVLPTISVISLKEKGEQQENCIFLCTVTSISSDFLPPF